MTMKPKKILIADDQDFSRNALRKALIEKQFTIAGEASTGKEAVELNKKLHPDLIFMDVKMPELNGIDASREITLYNPVPIILLTVKDDPDTIERARTAGVMAYLIKPFNKKELVPNIEVACARFCEFKALKKDYAGLKDTLETRKLTEQAKGILMKKEGISEKTAYKKIQKLSMDKQTPMKEIAKSIIITSEL